jgi:hypothetical protein
VTLVAPSGVLVCYPTTSVVRRRWRWRTPAGQVTPSGGVRAGIVAPGRVAAIGAEPDWAWNRRLELARRVARGRSGEPSVKKTGPARKVWSYPWNDGVDLTDLRAGTADRIATETGMPIGSAEDAWSSLWTFLERELAQGEMPCVFLPVLPATTSSILDPSQFAYCIAQADAHTASGVLGREGTSEVVRLEALLLEELRK